MWAVLREDLYDSNSGDEIFLEVRGIALNSIDAQALIALAPPSELIK